MKAKLKTKKKLKIGKKIRYSLEFCLAYIFFYFIKIFPLLWSSKCGYFIGYYFLQYFLGERKVEILNNISRCFPEKNSKEIYSIFRKSCGVFGSVIFEIPHLKELSKRINIIDPHNIVEYISKNKALAFSGHFGNWEIAALPFNNHHSYAIYKKPKNSYLDRFFIKFRSHYSQVKMIALDKSKILFLNSEIKKDNVCISMLVDQKIKEGILVDFFGKKAYTATVLPMLSLKHDIALIPIKVLRKPNCNFDIILDKPIKIKKTGNSKKDIQKLTLLMTNKIENWIKTDPEQWFWLHKRW